MFLYFHAKLEKLFLKGLTGWELIYGLSPHKLLRASVGKLATFAARTSGAHFRLPRPGNRRRKPPFVALLARTVTVGGYPTLEIFIIKENPITILQDLTMIQ